MCKMRYKWYRGHCGISGCGHTEAVWIERCKEANARERRVPCPNPRPTLRITEAFAMGLCRPCLGWAVLIPGAPELVDPERVDRPRRQHQSIDSLTS
ncbi:uncharacterized protein N7487_008068 [Penicillium crustosum]|uniref:uncharacterized protein n=1 Tax=Penicillium crustosum TaxID=36656 RepID=UPI00238D9869|nr:uncharacterized protein N7487_008068 [Penicillium crustosum]KAJ5402172.1 hypothetical protein N7487_008068 [Penicillium crustosum]